MAEEFKRLVPDPIFETWTPDEVAECLEVGEELYRKLWDLVREYRQPRRPEHPEEKWVDALKRFWGRFTLEEQRRLNDAARKEFRP